MSEVLGIRGAGVSLLREDRLQYITSNSEAMASLERVQELHQQGPCVEAARTGGVFAVTDLDGERERWPVYVAHASMVGIRAVAGVPMRSDGDSIGAVNLYDDRPRHWSDEDLEIAHVLTDIATSYVINAAKLDQQRLLSEQLQRALDSRVVIEQAKGIISEDRGVSIDDAFKILRKHANDHHAGLHVTAAAVVNLGLRP